MITALIIFLITYLFIGLRQVPRLHIDRPAGALVGAVLMIVTGVLTLDQAFAAIDMHTLLLLLGMMIVTVYLRAAGFFELMADRILSLSKTPFQLLVFVAVSSGLAGAMIGRAGDLAGLSPFGRIAGLSLVSAVISNVVSNVPAVMLLKPLTLSPGGDRFIWLALAMSSTLAGNFTLIGSVANLIVAQQARRRVEIGFMEYFRVGALITVITIIMGIVVLFVEVKAANGAERAPVSKLEKTMTVKVTTDVPGAVPRTLKVVLVFDNDTKRARGIQGFRPLQPDEAALFIFEAPAESTFWMGTVTFPIDIIFIKSDGKVVRVYSGRMPGSAEFFPSGTPVKWVIETAAGSGIRVGDRVSIE